MEDAMDDKVEKLFNELGELSAEMVKVVADRRVTITEIIELGDDVGEVIAAVRALTQQDEEAQAARAARRAQRKAERRARRAARAVNNDRKK